MAQINNGIRSILSIPSIYNLFAHLVNKDNGGGTAALVKEYIRPQPQDKILDIGCGTGRVVSYLPDSIDYMGFDASPQYIEAAKKCYKNRATFICEHISLENVHKYSQFDIVLASGVLHHLDDPTAAQLFETAHAALKIDGRLITLDGVFVENQSHIARWLISKDRGQNIRTPEQYTALASTYFSDITPHIRHDLLTIPYTHFILECKKH